MKAQHFERYLIILFLCAFAVPCPQSTAQIYEAFTTFANQNFGAKSEPLIYDMFGNSLTFVDTGFWTHESEGSASIASETNLPATAYVEYGLTTAYGSRTATSNRYTYLHLSYASNLQADTLYHYRVVAVDERGTTLASADRTFQTRTPANVIHIPGDLAGPPYILDQSDSTYVLTADITANTRAFTIKGNNLVLDLNGHVVIYDNGPALVSNTTWDVYVYSSISTFGVHGAGVRNVKILNGTIRQGSNNGAGNISYGFNPIYLSVENDPVEVAGMTLEYAGNSVGGLMGHYGNVSAHHNVITDKGTGIDNRHQGIQALYIRQFENPIHHNLILRARHQGIVVFGPAYSNEVYVDSYATNSFAIKPVGNVYSNKIFGTGYHVVGVGWSERLSVYRNLIYLVATAPNTRSNEYGAQSSVNGVRLTQYDGGTIRYDGLTYYENTIVVRGRDGATDMRGVEFCSDPYITNLVFRDNVVKAVSEDSRTEMASCVVAQGISERGSQQAPVAYRNNTFISNTNHIRFGDDYAMGGNHQFRNCRFVKIGSDTRFNSIRIGFWIWDSFRNLIIDPILEGGSNLQSPIVEGTGKRDYTVGHSLYAVAREMSGAPIAGATIEVFDNTGRTFSGTTDATGAAKLELLDYTFAADTGQTSGTIRTRSGHYIQIQGFRQKQVTSDILAMRNTVITPLTIQLARTGAPSAPKNLRIGP